MDRESIRQKFPILDQKVNGEALIYFDNAATTQKPTSVLKGMMDYYQFDNANIHRGVHTLAYRATNLYEDGRGQVAAFIGAEAHELIFNRGTTEGLNFIARSLIEPQLEVGDIVLTSRLEHHSSIVPLQEVCHRQGASLEFLPLDHHFQVDLGQLEAYPFEKVKAIVVQHVSNVLGVEQPVKEIALLAQAYDIPVIVDGAQAVGKLPVNVKDLGVASYCFSGHKMYGPTGIGAVYLHQKYHEITEPFLYGGEMIHYVGDHHSTYKESPWKYEAGTMAIAEVVGLTHAVDFIKETGFDKMMRHEKKLTQGLREGLRGIEGVTVYGPEDYDQEVHGIMSFNIEGIHPHDAASAYDLEGIAIRAGHHCCQPLMRLLDMNACLRASVAVYNTMEEVEHFIAVTEKVRDYFRWDLKD